ncbi:MAG: hypothetical protein EXR58_04100 [Chloroflexi bacterium]|nr:hypothetical protein [Chloroflexota bacterium]
MSRMAWPLFVAARFFGGLGRRAAEFLCLQAEPPRPLRLWVPIVVFAATCAIYVATIPHFVLFASPPTGDQPSYLMITASLAEDRDFDLANQFANHEEDRFYSLAPHPPGFVGMAW